MGTFAERAGAGVARQRSLDQLFPHHRRVFSGTGLWPKDASARALARAAAAEMHSGVDALMAALPMNFRLVRKSPKRSAGVDANLRRIEGIWRDCR